MIPCMYSVRGELKNMDKYPPLHGRYHVSHVVHAHLASRRLVFGSSTDQKGAWPLCAFHINLLG